MLFFPFLKLQGLILNANELSSLIRKLSYPISKQQINRATNALRFYSKAMRKCRDQRNTFFRKSVRSLFPELSFRLAPLAFRAFPRSAFAPILDSLDTLFAFDIGLSNVGFPCFCLNSLAGEVADFLFSTPH